MTAGSGSAAWYLEVKGDFCHKVRDILQRYRREGDYVEVSLDSEYRYNPLHNELDAYALAYNIAVLLQTCRQKEERFSGNRPTRTL